MAYKTDEISPKTAIDIIPGVSTVRSKYFEKLGITTLGELIEHFPRGYQNRGNVKLLKDAQVDTVVSLVLTVGTDPKTAHIRSSLSITKFKAFDESGTCEIIFYNRRFADKTYVRGATHRFYGKITKQKGMYVMNSPESEPYYNDGEDLLSLVPIYPLSAGLTQKTMQNSQRYAVDMFFGTPILKGTKIKLPFDPIPESIRLKYELCTRAYAFENIHFPSDENVLYTSRRRLAFEEMFLLSMSLTYAKVKNKNPESSLPNTDLSHFKSALEYKLTGAQERAVDAIISDLRSVYPMNRLVSGDVGSGKTVCAAAAAYIAIKNGKQAALMVPTEILARQHYKDLSELFSHFGYKTALLVGALKASEKKEIYATLASGEIDFVIGTHALLSDNVVFKDLSLVITDEQHRFGVRQRAMLGEKAEGVNVLVMSATPIPRTLALILYGDLDISVIDEMPPGRQRVDTFTVNESYRDRLNAFIRKQTDAGGRVYIVCPAVEEDESEEDAECDCFELYESENKLPLKSAVDYAKKLKEEVFPDLSVGYVHGKMKSLQKDEIMNAFAKGDIQVLVSTTVIEVGVNVPEATLMIVENAERFGLSQLHQLRGRVGRGKQKSYCILVSDAPKNSKSAERLEIMKTTYDGYKIAEQDLEKRGPGDFVGSNDLRQHGRVKLKLASFGDAQLMINASSAVSEVLSRDPLLEFDEHAELKEAIDERARSRITTVN